MIFGDNVMLKKGTSVTLLLIGLCLCLPATSVIGKTSSNAAEAQSVRVIWTSVGSEGEVNVEGCVKCPLKLVADGKTKFYGRGKKIKPGDTGLYSGRTGTVIYDVSDKHVLKVLW
jgi:hypothetical protein